MTAQRAHRSSGWRASRYFMSALGFALLAVPTWWLWSAVRLAEVPSESMEPTLLPGDVLAVRIDAYRKEPPARGDIIILRDPKSDGWMVKRVVGEPGEELVVASGHVVTPYGWLEEPYIREPKVRERAFVVRLATDEVFVMGDNRDRSDDSRDFGPVKLNRVVGRVAGIIWPWSRRTTIPRFVDIIPDKTPATNRAPGR
ncbi:MAG: signal peptidase I [Armatimonadetes bacterium]|nr:signal peptidase I [Armatimonadota bacterium]